MSYFKGNRSADIAMQFWKEFQEMQSNESSDKKIEDAPRSQDEGGVVPVVYFPFLPLEDVIEKTVEKYGLVNFLVLLMMLTLLFSLALVALMLALASWVSIHPSIHPSHLPNKFTL